MLAKKYGENTLSKSGARKWFASFGSVNVHVKDAPWRLIFSTLTIFVFMSLGAWVLPLAVKTEAYNAKCTFFFLYSCGREMAFNLISVIKQKKNENFVIKVDHFSWYNALPNCIVKYKKRRSCCNAKACFSLQALYIEEGKHVNRRSSRDVFCFFLFFF